MASYTTLAIMAAQNLEISLGARIRARRTELGLSQEGLSLACEIDRTAVAKIEAGQRSIRIDTLARIAEGLRTTMSRLLEGLK